MGARGETEPPATAGSDGFEANQAALDVAGAAAETMWWWSETTEHGEGEGEGAGDARGGGGRAR